MKSPESGNAVVKSICDIMRRSNCAGALQYVPKLTWILFLRILDEREAHEADEAAALGLPFTPSLKTPFRWRDWAAPDSPRRQDKDPAANVWDFVHKQLLPHLKGLKNARHATPREIIRVMVRVVDPQIGKTVYDPGCGTGGFLAQAFEYMREKAGKHATGVQLETLRRQTFYHLHPEAGAPWGEVRERIRSRK